MTTSAEYTQIAALVKGWADKIDNAAGVEYAIVGEVADEMRAFSNSLVAKVNMFASVLDATTPEETEAAAIALVNKGLPHQQCNRDAVHAPHTWSRFHDRFACNGVRLRRDLPPMVPEEV